MIDVSAVAPTAVVALANHAVIPSGRTQQSPLVQSRMLLWCRGGAGTVRLNGTPHRFRAGLYAFLPWDTEIVYQASPEAALQLGGIHLLPRCDADDPGPFRVSHNPGEEHEQLARTRGDAALPGLEGLLSGRFSEAPALVLLADYIVLWYRREQPRLAASRRLAQSLLQELVTVAGTPAAARHALPPPLQRVLDYVDLHLPEALDVPRMSALGACSPATLSRLFRQHLGTTPIHWLRRRRIDEAARLLSATELPAAAIGRQVGIDDACYFSKLFRQVTGITCTEHRRRGSLFGG